MTEERPDLQFSELLDLASAVFHVPQRGRAALTARLKHLQGKRFPPGVNTGRSSRVRYDMTGVVAVSFVLALTASFVPPDIAVSITTDNWPTIRRLVHAAARSNARLAERAGEMERGDTVAVLRTNALADLGTADPTDGRASAARGIRRLDTASTAAVMSRGLAGEVTSTVTAVDVADLVDRIADAMLDDLHRPAGLVLAGLMNVGTLEKVDATRAAAPTQRPPRRMTGTGPKKVRPAST